MNECWLSNVPFLPTSFRGACLPRPRPALAMRACWALLCVALVACPAPIAAQSITVYGTSDPNAATALSDTVTSYQMLSPSITINIATPSTETAALTQLLNGTLDFISTTMMLSSNLTSPSSPLYSAAASDLLWCPYVIAPLVPIYRLDSVIGTVAITLSSSTLCSIYAGGITWWNDSRITALNTGLTLPNTSITVVVEAVPSSLTLAFTQALSTLCAGSLFASTIGVTASPVWPVGSYGGYVASPLPSSTVLVVNGAIGFTSLAVAQFANVNVAALRNGYNGTVVASAMSATFAATELLAQASSVSLTAKLPATASTLLPATLDSPTGQQAWPMTLVSAFVIHTNTTSSRGSCETRAALVSFINFMYSSSAVAAILASRSYAAYPSVALDDLSLPGLLQTAVRCNDGSLAYALASTQSLQSTDAAAETHTLYGDSRFSTVLSLVAGLFTEMEQRNGETVEVNYEGTSDIWPGVEAVLSGQVEAALLTLDMLNLTQQAAVVAARDSGDFYLLPMFVSAVIPVYNPQLNATIRLPSTLTMDPVTLLTVAGRLATDWRAAVLAPVVAPLALVNLSTPLPIHFISPCNTSAPGTRLREYLSLFWSYAPILSDYLFNTSSTLYSQCNSSVVYDSRSFVPGQSHGMFPAPTDAAVPSVINAVSGSMGYQRATATVEPAVIYVDFGTGVGGVTANVSSLLACLDAFDAHTLMAQLNTSSNPGCYLFSRTVYAIVPTSIIDTAGDGCTARREMLQFLQQLTELDTYDALLNDQLLVRAGQVQAVQAAVLDALNSITCIDPASGDSDTLLVQTPIVWSLSKAITTVGLALGSIGIVCAIASLAVTAIFHRHSVMRAASPVFLCLTLLGLAVMFVSALMLSLPPSTVSCAGLSWCFHLGFQLAFAPLLAKTYRVYRIYGGQKLSVVKLSNSRLALIVAALLTMEVGLLAAFQGVSPMRPLIVSRNSGSPLRVHDYGQCSVDSAGLPLFIALCIEKGVVLILGALMAFSTRRVSATYSESSGIAWSIYNLILSMAVLVPLVLLIDAVGDTLVALLLFALLWVSAFTLAVLFVPRLSAMLSKAEAMDEHDSGARVVGDGGFSFLSLASFEAGSGAMGQYVAALELHLVQAKARFSQLKQGDTKGKEWMKATTGRKQSVASTGHDSSVNRAPQQEPRKAREKSIATVTGAPKPSLSYMTQTNYGNDAARSNAGSPSLVPAQRGKLAMAASSRTQLAMTNGGSSTAASKATPTVSATVSLQSAPRDSPSSRGLLVTDAKGQQQQQQSEQKLQQTTTFSSSVVGLSPIEAVTDARPASVSRSRSIRVQPSFEKAAVAPSDRPGSAARTAQSAAAEAPQPDDSSKPEESTHLTEQQSEQLAAADASHYGLPALPVADDMVVHDLSSRMARASIDESSGQDEKKSALVVKQPTVMRPRANSRGILMTPVTGSATSMNSSSDDSMQAADVAVNGVAAEHGGDLDIDTGEAMQDIE